MNPSHAQLQGGLPHTPQLFPSLFCFRLQCINTLKYLTAALGIIKLHREGILTLPWGSPVWRHGQLVTDRETWCAGVRGVPKSQAQLSKLHFAMIIHLPVFVWAQIFSSSGYTTRSEIAGSYSNSMFNLWRNYQTIFQHIIIFNTLFPPAVYELPVSLHLCQHLLSSGFLSLAILCLCLAIAWRGTLLWFVFAFLSSMIILNFFMC